MASMRGATMRSGARLVGALLAALAAACLLAPLLGAAPARAATEPIFAWVPETPPEAKSAFPPDGFLNGPCGLAVDSEGDFYVADRYHGAVEVFTAAREYVTGLFGLGEPCGLALDSAGRLYVNAYHGAVTRYTPTAYPPRPAPTPPATEPPQTKYGEATPIDPGPATGVAVDPATGHVYVDRRTYVNEYDASGSFVRRIGEGTLGDGYGVAVSGFPGTPETAGYLYVPDAATNTVEVFDTSAEPAEPLGAIEAPPGGFTSLRDSTVAVDDASGEVYVIDDLQPAHAEQPRAVVWAFDSLGHYEGHLRYEVVDGSPSGLAVDNSSTGRYPGGSQGIVYATSGNTHPGGVYAYTPEAAAGGSLAAPKIPPSPLGGRSLFPTVPIGGPAAQGNGILCQGDSCQILPPEPVDPALTTTLPGLGNPRVRYSRARRDCRPVARAARRRARRAARASRRARRAGGARSKRLRAAAAKLRRRYHRTAHALRRCRGTNRGPSHGARASAAAAASGAPSGGEAGASSAASAAAPAPAGGGGGASAAAAAAAPIEAGFEASAWDAAGGPASLAGSHPYELELSLGLDQGGGAADLREASVELPEGLLAAPPAAGLCSSGAFSTPRSSPFEASASGESCPARSQVGTLEVETPLAGGARRRFGLFDLDPAAGYAIQLGASPYGAPVAFGGRIGADGRGAALTLSAAVPAGLRARGLRLNLWGVPWDASHNGERGECLNEAKPSFPWAGCSVGDPFLSSQDRPLALLTLPTVCGAPLSLAARASSWQGTGALSATASAGAPLGGCAQLDFKPRAEGLLTVKKASSSSGFVFRLTGEDPGLADPRSRIESRTGGVRLRLPAGVTLNPSLAAGLQGCEPGSYAAESPFTAYGAGCPDSAKIGEFSVRSPFYEGLLEGAVYLAQPYRNPFGSLLAIYLVAKSADRGVLVKAAGRIDASPVDGSLTATFPELPQLPYEELEVNLRSGQRAPLVSPPACGPATTRFELLPSAQGVASVPGSTDSQIETGIEAGPCPDGSVPPFSPGVSAGGVNSNVGSYTPYFVHLIRHDDEQEITSYSLTLPEGIVGKLAGVPFCGDAAIAAARGRAGFAEAADPSCPAASQVGRTLTGYGVGAALTYAAGRIYLAGPYHGQPLSLVTINPATIGPFDLGTIVVRSAFTVDPRSARLGIDSRASDPIPHIIDGIPLHLRDVRVYMDRPEFTRNPTGCEPSQLESTLTGSGARFDDPSDDSTATAAERFQLLNCLTLGFRPRLGLRLSGGARRGAYPGLRAVFQASKGDADLRRIAVSMPSSLFLAQNHIRTVCTRGQFAAEACPKGSVYGRAAAATPLFDEPLRGPVLLRSSDNKLPDLVATLRSGEVRIVLEGRIGPSKKGGIRAFFDGLPDAPVNRFTMWLYGGNRGLLVNSVNVCARPPKASVKALAHNNRGAIFTTRLRGRCAKAKKKGHGKHAKGGKSGKKKHRGGGGRR
jgi:hypothetical protein